jgi:hypothetical protein
VNVPEPEPVPEKITRVPAKSNVRFCTCLGKFFGHGHGLGHVHDFGPFTIRFSITSIRYIIDIFLLVEKNLLINDIVKMEKPKGFI